MSRVLPWIDEADPDTREALAAGVLAEMESLQEHPGWQRVVAVIDQMIVGARDEMERTGRDVDLFRGGLKASRKIKGLPQLAIERATAELYGEPRGNN